MGDSYGFFLPNLYVISYCRVVFLLLPTQFFSNDMLGNHSFIKIFFKGFELLVLQIIAVTLVAYILALSVFIPVYCLFMKNAYDNLFSLKKMIIDNWGIWFCIMWLSAIVYFFAQRININAEKFFLSYSSWCFLAMITIVEGVFIYRLYRVIKPILIDYLKSDDMEMCCTNE